MKVLLSVEHPAWAHQFKKIVEDFQAAGDEVLILSIDKDGVGNLLDTFGLSHVSIARSTGKSSFEKAWLLVSLTLKILWHGFRFGPDIFVGRASPMMALTSFVLRKPHVIFEDTEHSHISLFFCQMFSSKIVTPNCFRRDLGRKQLRKPLYKESFYLHPNQFEPDPAIYQALGVDVGDPYVLLRFVSWQADHDLGHSGLTMESKKRVVLELSKFARVFISSELPLESFFEPYLLKAPRDQIHSIIYFASLVYGESSTMASEAALLGTHAIFCDFAGRGYTDEQEQEYGLVFNFSLNPADQEASILKALELIQEPGLVYSGKKKRQKLLAQTIDGTEYFQSLITVYRGDICAA
jgi:predicted glycosyltransferase